MKTSFSTKGIPVEIIPDEELGGFTARIPDISAYGEGKTEEEAIADLKEALTGYIETFGMDDALSRLRLPSKVLFVNWTLEDLSHA
ncbi:MAG: type II toxin-antitoxin system HicB family antitoxin [Patescibacteria group bacterium]